MGIIFGFSLNDCLFVFKKLGKPILSPFEYGKKRIIKGAHTDCIQAKSKASM